MAGTIAQETLTGSAGQAGRQAGRQAGVLSFVLFLSLQALFRGRCRSVGRRARASERDMSRCSSQLTISFSSYVAFAFVTRVFTCGEATQVNG